MYLAKPPYQQCRGVAYQLYGQLGISKECPTRNLRRRTKEVEIAGIVRKHPVNVRLWFLICNRSTQYHCRPLNEYNCPKPNSPETHLCLRVYVTCLLPCMRVRPAASCAWIPPTGIKPRSGPLQSILNSTKFRPRIIMSSANFNVDDPATLATDKQLGKRDDTVTISTAIPAPERGTAFWLVFFAICLALFVSALDAVSTTTVCLTRADSLINSSIST